MLSYLEQVPLHNSINFQVPNTALWGLVPGHPNYTAACQVLDVFLCPSDPLAVPLPAGTARNLGGVLAPTNYRSNGGQRGYCGSGRSDGGFNHSGTQLAGFRDGLSSTLAYSEKLVGDGSHEQYDPRRDFILGNPPGPSSSVSADAWVKYCSGLTYQQHAAKSRSDSGRTWMLGHGYYTKFYVSAPPNAQIPDCGRTHAGLYAARSLHPGGVNAVMADGSARFFANGTNLALWRALGTRSGGEVVSIAD